MSTLGPWRWLINCPERRRVELLRLWAAILEALVKATPRRDDPRLHVTDLLMETEGKPLSPEVARLLCDGVWKHAKWAEIMQHTGLVIAHEKEIASDGVIGTPDYLLQQTARMVFDVKSVGEGNFKRVREGIALPHHRDQLVSYLGMDPAEFGVLLYEDRDTLDLALCCVERDPERAQKIRERRAGHGPEGPA